MLLCWRTYFILLCFLSCDSSAPEVPVCPGGVVKLRLNTSNPIKFCHAGYLGDGLDVGRLIASVRLNNNVTKPKNMKLQVKFVGDLKKGRCWFDIEGYHEKKDLRISYMEEGKGQSKEDYKILQTNNCTVQKNSSVEPPSEVPTSIPTTKATPRPQSNSTNSSTTLGPGRTTPTPETDATLYVVIPIAIIIVLAIILVPICIKLRKSKEKKRRGKSKDVEDGQPLEACDIDNYTTEGPGVPNSV